MVYGGDVAVASDGSGSGIGGVCGCCLMEMMVGRHRRWRFRLT